MKTTVGISSFRNREIVFVILLLFTLHIGCSNLPISRTERTGEEPHTVGVVSARFHPVVKLDMPPMDKFSRGVMGAVSGFMTWAKVPADFLKGGLPGAGTEQGAYLAVVILAVAAVAGSVGGILGGIRGALHSPTPEEAEIIEVETRNSFRNLRIQETMQDYVLKAAEGKNRFKFAALQDVGPNEPDQECDYRAFSESDIDTVLEVGVLSIGFQGEAWGKDPPLSFFMKTLYRKIRVEDGLELLSKEITFTSNPRNFHEWTENRASLLEEEFQRGYRQISENIVSEVFSSKKTTE